MKLKKRESDLMLNDLERNLSVVRKIRLSSGKVRGTLSFKSVDSTWKISEQSMTLNHNET